MDPLSAISLASAITQFIDFAGKIAIGTHQVYVSGAGATAADADLELCASELDGLCTRLSTNSLSPKSADDQALCRLAGRCNALSAQLSSLLRSTRAKDPSSRWNCFVSSVKTQIKKTERDELVSRLSECRAQLEVQLVRLTSLENETFQKQLAQSIQANDQGFLSLSNSVRSLRDNVAVSNFSAGAKAQLQELFRLPENSRRSLVAGRILNILHFEGIYDRVEDVGIAHEGTFAWALDDHAPVLSFRGAQRSVGPLPREPHVDLRRLSAHSNNSLLPISKSHTSPIPHPSTQIAHQEFRTAIQSPSSSLVATASFGAHQAKNDFMTWLRSGRGVYHIVGGPDTGKSTFMKYLCRDGRTTQLLSEWAAGSHLLLGKCFLHRKGSKMQKSIAGLCRTILHDILRQSPQLAEAALPELWMSLESTSSSQFEPKLYLPTELLQEALSRLFKGLSRTLPYKFCIFIDALNEQEEENFDHTVLLNLLLSWVSSSPGNVKLCVSTRQNWQFTEAFDSYETLHLHKHTFYDLKKFVSESVQMPRSLGITQEHQLTAHTATDESSVVAAITHRADGDFRWASLASKAVLRTMSGDSQQMHLLPALPPRGDQIPSRPEFLPNATGLDAALDTVLLQQDIPLYPTAGPSWPDRISSPLTSGFSSPGDSVLHSDSSKAGPSKSQIKELEVLLGAPEVLQDDLSAIEDARLDGTCAWFTTKSSYLNLIDPVDKGPKVLWLSGSPAAGKSTLAGYLVNTLQASGSHVSHFFFKHADKSKSTFGACLKALALQMAQQSLRIKEQIVALSRDDTTLEIDNGNARLLWRRIFIDTIFPNMPDRQYWVIDALDECEDVRAAFTTALGKLNKSLPLRILVTSRDTALLLTEFSDATSHMRLEIEKLSSTDTFDDVQLLVEARVKLLPAVDAQSIPALTEQILSKSNGSFLWTTLVLRELSEAHSDEDIRQVLEDVPQGMEPLYYRTLDTMSRMQRGKNLVRAILTWITCAIRPLTITELDGALRILLKENFSNLESSIRALCGQLVYVDKTRHVHMVHETAREFLLSANTESDFAVAADMAHCQVAQTCLKYLAGDEMKPPRSVGRGSANSISKNRIAFSAYACSAFSFHLSKAGRLSSHVFTSLQAFLSGNMLSWIEFMARSSSLNPITECSVNLSMYLASLHEHGPLPPNEKLTYTERWATDLTRICAKFADALSASPAAIYTVVPPFCPLKSAIFQTARTHGRLSVVGPRLLEWDDRLSCIDFHIETRSVCHGTEIFAVGLSSGIVALYHALTGQEYKLLDSGDPVNLLCFLGETGLLASYGTRDVLVWNITRGEIIYRLQMPQRCIAIAYDGGILNAACSRNFLVSWDISRDALRLPDRPWDPGTDANDGRSRRPSRQSSAVSMSMEHRVLAVASPGLPILLWDLDSDSYYGSCGKKLANGDTSVHLVTALVINPNATMELLAASYLDGELVIIDLFMNETLTMRRANCPKLAASPDGALLAGAAGAGVVDVYQFETLDLLCRIRSSNLYIKQLVFSSDSLRFVDIRGTLCNVWGAAALRQKAIAHRGSSVSTIATFVEATTAETNHKITAMVVQIDDGSAICGESDGSVTIYSLRTGEQQKTLYRHRALVRGVTWWPAIDTVVSVDATNSIMAWRLTTTQHGPEGQVFQSRLHSAKAITQLLAGHSVDKIILSTRDSDHLWNLQGSEERSIQRRETPSIRKWIQHPSSPAHVLCIDSMTISIYTWSNWSRTTSLPSKCPGHLQLKNALSCTYQRKQAIVLELSELDGGSDSRDVYLLDVQSLAINAASSAEEATRAPDASTILASEPDLIILPAPFIYKNTGLESIARRISHIIGFLSAGKLLFLDRYSWVCSFELDQSLDNKIRYYRHFFIPYDWFSGTREILAAVSRRSIIFIRNDSVIIFKGGLEFAEEVTL